MNTPTINKSRPVPRRRGKLSVPPAVRSAAQAYKAAYRALYGIPPALSWDGKWVRLAGHKEGVTPRRLKELTAQLIRRIP